MVLVLEDLHWVDTSTISFLRRLLADDRALPLLVLASFRDTELDQARPSLLLGGVDPRVTISSICRPPRAPSAHPGARRGDRSEGSGAKFSRFTDTPDVTTV